MKVTSHRDGTYSITGLTSLDMRNLSFGCSAAQLDYHADLRKIEAGSLPTYMMPDDSLEFAEQYVRDRLREFSTMDRTVREVL